MIRRFLYSPPLSLDTQRKLTEETRKEAIKRKREKEDAYIKELGELFQKIASDGELVKEFLRDILTPKEYKNLGIRWQIVKQLAKGLSQRQISDNLCVSIATITRGSRELLDKKGGFNQVLEKYYAKK